MKFYILFFTLFFQNLLHAQTNLVPNPSFEDYNNCPNFLNFVFPSPYDSAESIGYYLNNWFKAGKNISSASYFNECVSNNFAYDVPKNLWGYQFAKTGKAYSGIYTMAFEDFKDNSQYPDINQIDYIETKLTTKLSANNIYKICYYISQSFSDTCFANLKINYVSLSNLNINAHLSSSRIKIKSDDTTSSFYLQNVICVDTNKYFSDSINWLKNSGLFKAKGDENYLTIGNFSGFDSTKIKKQFNTVCKDSFYVTIWESYYYIDDVSLIDVTHFIQGDTVLCPSGNGRLTATIAFDKYLWNTGSQDTFININAPGVYWCTVQEGCSVYTDTFVVKAPTDSLPPPKPTLGQDFKTCTNELEIWPQQLAITLPINNESITWNTGTFDNNKPIININAAGIYIVTIHNACLASSDTIIVEGCPLPTIFIPTAFTPNDDGLNDALSIKATGINPTSWQVYNRYGNKVFETQNYFEWDGYHNGKPCESGTYYYVLRYSEKNKTDSKIFKGSVDLLR
jgi:gliding motility-associated-like protein